MNENDDQYDDVELRLTKEAADSIRLLSPEQITHALSTEIRNAYSLLTPIEEAQETSNHRVFPEPRPRPMTAEVLALMYNQRHGQHLPDDLHDLVPEEFGFEILDTLQGYAQASRGSTMQITCRELGVYFQISKYTTKLNADFKLPKCFVPSIYNLGSLRSTYEQQDQWLTESCGKRLYTNEGLKLFLQRHWANHLLENYRRKDSFLVPVTQRKKSVISMIDPLDVDVGYEIKLKGSGRKTAIVIGHLKVFPKDVGATNVEYYCTQREVAEFYEACLKQFVVARTPNAAELVSKIKLYPTQLDYQNRHKLYHLQYGHPHYRKTKREFNRYSKLLSKIRKLRG